MGGSPVHLQGCSGVCGNSLDLSGSLKVPESVSCLRVCRKRWNDRSDVVSVCLFDGQEDRNKAGFT